MILVVTQYNNEQVKTLFKEEVRFPSVADIVSFRDEVIHVVGSPSVIPLDMYSALQQAAEQGRITIRWHKIERQHNERT